MCAHTQTNKVNPSPRDIASSEDLGPSPLHFLKTSMGYPHSHKNPSLETHMHIL